MKPKKNSINYLKSKTNDKLLKGSFITINIKNVNIKFVFTSLNEIKYLN